MQRCLQLWLVGWLLSAVGCGAPGAAPADVAVSVDTSTGGSDVARAETDAASGPACPGGSGCSCSAAADCALGLCLPTLAGLQCAGPCGSGCSSGSVCVAVATAGGDIQTVCVDRNARACQPCQSNADCAQPGTSGGACVDNGEAPWFCAPDCATPADCPAGWRCAAAADATGASALRCLPPGDDVASMQCPCTPLAVALAATGRCTGNATSSEGQSLRCPGTARCDAVGAAATCQASALEPELCVDAQCLGQSDGTACDDNNPCSSGDACQSGQCQPGSPSCACEVDADCAAKEDGDLCNGTLRCDLISHTCQIKPGSAVVCSQQGVGVCEERVCVPQTGQCQVQPVANGVTCEDGEACTQGDQCQQGSCAPGANVCACQSHADCAGQPTNLCFGSLYCDKSAIPYQCKPNPASAVVCSAAQNTACLKNQCQPATGQCQLTAVVDGTPCQDGYACTTGDTCVAGGCQPGASSCACSLDSDCAPYEDNNLCNGTLFCNVAAGICQPNPATAIYCSTATDGPCQTTACVPATGKCQTSLQPAGTSCDDGNPCSLGDSCQDGQCAPGSGQCACQSDDDCASKEDGNLCNGTLFCNKQTGSCAVNPATVVTCEAGDAACSTVSCEPATGACVPTPYNEGLPCKDADPCTTDEVCSAGTCVGTSSACSCKSDADCEAEEDGDLCNGTLYCDKSTDVWQCKVKPLSVVVCPAAQAGSCSVATCDPTSGACVPVPLPDGASCTDGVACTSGDACASGVCVGASSACECQADSDCAAKDDGDPCTGVWFCNKAQFPYACQLNAASVVQCSSADDTACMRNRCDPQSATCVLTPEPAATPCQDGNPCTQDDTCITGSCVGGTAKPCADPSQCQTASCAPDTGQCLPMPKPDGSACTDGNNCTLNDQCAGGSCKGSVDPCDDDNACTLDSCKVGPGCQHAAQPDFSACTLASDCGGTTYCQSGSCVLADNPCDTGSPCAVGTCGPSDQCLYETDFKPLEGLFGCETCAYGNCYQRSNAWSVAPGQVAIGGMVSQEPPKWAVYAFGPGQGQIEVQGQFPLHIVATGSAPEAGVLTLHRHDSDMTMQLAWLGWGWQGDGSAYGQQTAQPVTLSSTPHHQDFAQGQPVALGQTVCVLLNPTAQEIFENVYAGLACMGEPLLGQTAPLPTLQVLAKLPDAGGGYVRWQLRLVATGPDTGPYVCALRTGPAGTVAGIVCHADSETTWTVEVPKDVHEVVLASENAAPPKVVAARRIGSAPFALQAGVELSLDVTPGAAIPFGHWSLLDPVPPAAWAGPDGQLWVHNGTALVAAPLPAGMAYWRPLDAQVFGPDPCNDGGAVRIHNGEKLQTWAWGKPMYDAFVTQTPVDVCQPFLLVDGG